MLQGCSQVYCAVLKASLELNLFEIIAKEGGRHVSASEVSSKLPSSSQHKDLASRIDRLLRLLASYSLLNCSVREKEDGVSERLYAISPVGTYFVGGDNNGGLMTLFSSFLCHKALTDAWYSFIPTNKQSIHLCVVLNCIFALVLSLILDIYELDNN